MSVLSQPAHTISNDDFGKLGNLVRFIDDWDKHFSHGLSSRASPEGRTTSRRGIGQGTSVSPSFVPRFDVKETEQNYELHGELPGVEKKNITIEFSDSQTIIIRGNVERTYQQGNPPAGFIEHHDDDSSESSKPLQPTVEDEKNEGKHNDGGNDAKSEESASNPTKAKFWVYERSVGNFQRSFTFANRVDPDNVKASLDNGILTVTVPKAKKSTHRRIAIS